MTGKQSGLYIVGDVPQPSYFTQIPNIAIQQLDAYAFKLLGVLMDLTRKTAKCWLTNKQIAERVGCSVNHMKKARAELESKGYVLIAEGTKKTRAVITVLFNDIWKMNADYFEELNPKPQAGLSHGDNPLSWDDNPLSQPDTLTKQDVVTRKENKKTLPPTPAQSEKVEKQETGVSVELKPMKAAVRQLKAYGDVGDRVAKTLLNLHEDDDKNVGNAPFKPDDIPKFIAWWTDKYPDLTIPRNSQSCVKWFNIWRDELETVAKPVTREIITLEQPPDNSDFMRQFMALPKVAGNHHG